MKKYAVSVFVVILMLVPTMVLAISDDRVSLGYIYNPSKSHTSIVNSSNSNINTVSPTCLDLSNDGHLVINNIFSQEFVNQMHEQNVLVTPFLSNHWSKGKAQAALANSEALSDEIVNTINQYNLDGVNIDLENLNASDRENLTDFIQILKQKMPEGKVLSIAVASNPNKLTTSWVAAYDYENLAKYADYLVLMAYDEHSSGGTEGPVASIPFVEESVKVMLESVSRDKIVLGMPLYGRFWKQQNIEFGEEPEPGGEAIIISQVERIASRNKLAMPMYNEYTGTATLTIQVESGDKKAYVNGRYLEEGVYTIWYENETSYLRKLQLMNQYGLKGAALWAIGNEGSNFWNYYAKGFANEEYESEKSIKEKQYYEEITRIMKTVEPLKLTVPLKLDHKIEKELQKNTVTDEKLFVNELEEKIHLPEEKKQEIEEPFLSNELVVMKEKNYKNIDNISIVHMIQRCFLKSY